MTMPQEIVSQVKLEGVQSEAGLGSDGPHIWEGHPLPTQHNLVWYQSKNCPAWVGMLFNVWHEYHLKSGLRIITIDKGRTRSPLE